MTMNNTQHKHNFRRQQREIEMHHDQKTKMYKQRQLEAVAKKLLTTVQLDGDFRVSTRASVRARHNRDHVLQCRTGTNENSRN